MSSQPLKVLIVAEDRKELRRLSKFLNTFGYETQQVADPPHVSLLLKTYSPDFLIIEGSDDLRQAFSICRAACGSEDAPSPYTLLLLESPQIRDLSAALQVGVDDFLTKPADYGEILARLRSGARRREFERRFRAQSGIDPHTGLPNRSVFRTRLANAIAQNAGGVCVLLEIDFHAQINADKEWLAGRNILREVAVNLLEGSGDNDLVASFGDGRFGIFLNGLSESELNGISEAEAEAWSERIRYMLNDIEFNFGDEKRRVTVSSGVISLAPGEHLDADQVLEKAASALLVAQRSGYNYVADSRECDDEAKAWNELAAPGTVFQRTTARDVMTPCTLMLQMEDSIARADRAFRRHQTNVLPVVNAKGLFQGVLTADAVANHDSTESYHVRDLMSHDVKRFDETESFERLKEFFAADSRPYAVVIRQGRPTGLVTPNNLIALGTFLNSDTFRSDKPSYVGSPDLQVVEI